MANTRNYGFRAVKGYGSNDIGLIYHTVATGYDGQDGSANSVDINIGDPVKRVNSGTIALATAGDEVLGIAQAFKPYWDGSAMKPTNKLPNQNSWGTVEARRPWVGVAYAKQSFWEADFDAAHSTPTFPGYVALVGENFDHVLTGNTTATSARPEMDVDTNATSDATWRFEQISTRVTQDFTAAYVKGIFSINESEEGSSATGAGLYDGI